MNGYYRNGTLMASKIEREGTVSPTTVPAAPAVSAIGGVSMTTVSWNGVSGASSYNIYWSTTAGVTPATGTKITNAVSPYVHTGLLASTTYYYVVTSVNAVGESGPSVQVSATTITAQSAPAAPIGVSAAGGVNQATVSWAAVAGATFYTVYRSLNATGATTLFSNSISPLVQTGLTAGTTYYYAVTAINAAGESAPSTQVSATTSSVAVLPAPTGTAATGGINQVSISWNAVAGATSYNIYWSTTTGVTPLTGTVIVNATSPYVQTGLAASTTSYYVVTAVDAAGESAPSLQVSATTAAPAAACGTCHAIPPALGAHSFHAFTTCATCHGPGYSSTTTNAALHMNGAKDVTISIWNPTTRSCTASCHVARAW